MPKTWNDKERARAERRIKAKRTRLNGLRARLAASQAQAQAARKKSDNLAQAAYLAVIDLDTALGTRSRMDKTCHACGAGFALGDQIWIAYSQDGSKQAGNRCEPCQIVARKISPASVYGEDWQRYCPLPTLAIPIGSDPTL